jgi:hypothetical protein
MALPAPRLRRPNDAGFRLGRVPLPALTPMRACDRWPLAAGVDLDQ